MNLLRYYKQLRLRSHSEFSNKQILNKSSVCRTGKRVSLWINITSHITRGYVWQENSNTVFIKRKFCNYTRNKSNIFRLNKQRFEGSLVKNLRKAVDESALKWMLDSARNRTKITYTKIKYNLPGWNFIG